MDVTGAACRCAAQDRVYKPDYRTQLRVFCQLGRVHDFDLCVSDGLHLTLNVRRPKSVRLHRRFFWIHLQDQILYLVLPGHNERDPFTSAKFHILGRRIVHRIGQGQAESFALET